MSKSSRESLTKLKTLVEDLCDRDEGLKRDVALFEAVFKDFPVPVAIWLADEKGRCVSRRVTGSGSGWQDATSDLESVFNIYRSPDLKKEIDRHFKRAVKGKQMSFLSEAEGMCIWTRMTPRFSGETCVAVIGISWDVTANFRMYQTLRHVETFNPSSAVEGLSDLKTAARKAADASIVRVLLEDIDK